MERSMILRLGQSNHPDTPHPTILISIVSGASSLGRFPFSNWPSQNSPSAECRGVWEDFVTQLLWILTLLTSPSRDLMNVSRFIYLFIFKGLCQLYLMKYIVVEIIVGKVLIFSQWDRWSWCWYFQRRLTIGQIKWLLCIRCNFHFCVGKKC